MRIAYFLTRNMKPSCDIWLSVTDSGIAVLIEPHTANPMIATLASDLNSSTTVFTPIMFLMFSAGLRRLIFGSFVLCVFLLCVCCVSFVCVVVVCVFCCVCV